MEGKCRFELKVTDLDYDQTTSVDITTQLYPDLGWEATFEGEFASLINKFMGLLGYGGYKKDTIFLESVTFEEYDALLDFLADLRTDKNEQK